jgi:hypothetical protein
LHAAMTRLRAGSNASTALRAVPLARSPSSIRARSPAPLAHGFARRAAASPSRAHPCPLWVDRGRLRARADSERERAHVDCERALCVERVAAECVRDGHSVRLLERAQFFRDARASRPPRPPCPQIPPADIGPSSTRDRPRHRAHSRSLRARSFCPRSTPARWPTLLPLRHPDRRAFVPLAVCPRRRRRRRRRVRVGGDRGPARGALQTAT